MYEPTETNDIDNKEIQNDYNDEYEEYIPEYESINNYEYTPEYKQINAYEYTEKELNYIIDNGNKALLYDLKNSILNDAVDEENAQVEEGQKVKTYEVDI